MRSGSVEALPYTRGTQVSSREAVARDENSIGTSMPWGVVYKYDIYGGACMVFRAEECLACGIPLSDFG